MTKNKDSKFYWSSFKSLISLLFEHYCKNFAGPFFTFIFPLIFIALLGWLVGYYVILSGTFGIAAMAVALTSMPQAIFEFKRSTLLKRIGSTPIKPWMFVVITMFFYVVVMFIGLFWSIIISILIFIPYWSKIPSSVNPIYASAIPSMQQMLNNINWPCFIFSQIISMIIGLSCGMFLVSLFKTSISIQVFGVTIMITSMLLSSQLLPIAIVKQNQPIWIMGYIFSPFKSATNMVIESFNGYSNGLSFNVNNLFNSNIFDIYTNYEILSVIEIPGIISIGKMVIFNQTDKILNLVLPWIWIVIFIGISIWKFRWTAR